ncbi:transglutaminase family protein [Methylophilus sp. 3sh_L]|uniref:transglutaminase family protein n=1 Tax=Methylophilus sp. 3sh_L TaxID=3377114 RepID=UPI00398ED143
MQLTIEHQTQYVYSESVPYTIQQLRLTPRSDPRQQVKQWEIKVAGQLTPFEDAFGNQAHTLVIDHPHQALLITVSGEVDTRQAQSSPADALPLALFLRETPLTQPDDAIAGFVQAFAHAPALEMMQALRERMQYSKGATQVTTPAALAFQLGKGVCQDHAHAFIACCRSLGWPARYVSGYLFTEDGSLMQTHAWVEVWQHDAWLGLDVSNGKVVDETHIKLAVGLDYRSASPVTGSRMGGGLEGMASVVSVNRQAALSEAERHARLQQLHAQAQAAQQ